VLERAERLAVATVATTSSFRSSADPLLRFSTRKCSWHQPPHRRARPRQLDRDLREPTTKGREREATTPSALPRVDYESRDGPSLLDILKRRVDPPRPTREEYLLFDRQALSERSAMRAAISVLRDDLDLSLDRKPCARRGALQDEGAMARPIALYERQLEAGQGKVDLYSRSP